MPFISIKDINDAFDKKYFVESVEAPKSHSKKPLRESYHTEPRFYTTKLLDLYDDGVDPEYLILALAKYMSDDEVGEVLRINELYSEDEEDEEEVDECIGKPIREGRYGFLKRVGDCRIIETPTTFVVTDKFGTNIGESKTLAGAEGLAEEHSKGLKEDTVKTSKGKWVNKGDTGETHGEFKTKKEADAQRKAMFARGFKK